MTMAATKGDFTPVHDGENTVWQAIREVFPGTVVKGCVFHLQQRIFKKIQKVGLQQAYCERGDKYTYLRKLMALPYLPVEQIVPAYNRLKDVAYEVGGAIQEVANYMERTWVRGSVWQPANWCVFREMVRTNNDLEATGDQAESRGGLGCCGYVLWFLSLVCVIITLPFSLCLCIKVVQEYERAVIFRLGRLLSGGAKGPGLFFIVPCIDAYTKVDLRTVSFDVPPQEVLTKDSVTVAVDAVVYYRVYNATTSITNVEDANRSTRLLAATTLRNVLGTKNLSEILADREAISHQMQSSLDDATDPWGVKVERVEVKDVRLPVQLQRAMAAEAEASREARAKVIAAEGEQKASRALKEAADVMMESPAAIQLRYLQTLNTISAEKNSTIIFPVPIDIIKCMMGGKGQSTTTTF